MNANGEQDFFSNTESLNDIFGYYDEFQKKIQAAVAEMQEHGLRLLGDELITQLHTKPVREIRERAMEVLVRDAEDEFSAPGAQLQLNMYKISEAVYGKYPDKEDKIDLDALKSYLKSEYGGDKGERMSFSQEAKRLIDRFGINQRWGKSKETQKYTAWYASIRARKAFSGSGYQMDYGESSQVRDIFQGLTAFASWSDDISITTDFNKLNNALNHYNLEYNLGDKVETASLSIVLQKSDWVFQFSKPVMEKMKLYLGEYLTEKETNA